MSNYANSKIDEASPQNQDPSRLNSSNNISAASSQSESAAHMQALVKMIKDEMREQRDMYLLFLNQQH